MFVMTKVMLLLQSEHTLDDLIRDLSGPARDMMIAVEYNDAGMLKRAIDNGADHKGTKVCVCVR